MFDFDDTVVDNNKYWSFIPIDFAGSRLAKGIPGSSERARELAKEDQYAASEWDLSFLHAGAQRALHQPWTPVSEGIMTAYLYRLSDRKKQKAAVEFAKGPWLACPCHQDPLPGCLPLIISLSPRSPSIKYSIK